MGNNAIFRILYDCSDFWERDRERVSSALFTGEIHGGYFAVVNLSLESFCRDIFALISGQDVKKKIGCRWKLFQFGQHREKDPRRVEVSMWHLQRVKVAAVESAGKVKVSA